MKISIVIEKLVAIQAKRGDVPVLLDLTPCDGGCYSIADIEYHDMGDDDTKWVSLAASMDREELH